MPNNDTESGTVQSNEITLEVGASAQLGSEKVTFVRVVEDSRCPEGTECVWAGEVKVEVHFSEDETTFDSKTATLKSNQATLLFENPDHRYMLTAVHPYPKDGDLGKRNYEVVIEMEKK